MHAYARLIPRPLPVCNQKNMNCINWTAVQGSIIGEFSCELSLDLLMKYYIDKKPLLSILSMESLTGSKEGSGGTIISVKDKS